MIYCVYTNKKGETNVVNQCCICGAEMPEGNQVCRECLEKSIEKPTYTEKATGCMAITLGLIVLVFLGMFGSLIVWVLNTIVK